MIIKSKERKEIKEIVISCRNILLNNRETESIQFLLKEVVIKSRSIDILTTRNIFNYCINEALSEIGEANFVGAGLILNLIHNLPLDKMSEQKWEIDYFISVELQSFLEFFDNISSARQIVLFICNQLAGKYI